MTLDLSQIGEGIRQEVERRGLFLVPLIEPGRNDILFLCKDPRDPGGSSVGHVAAEPPFFVAYSPNSRRPWYNDAVAFGIVTWEAAIKTVLAVFDHDSG